jgi:hypothetical protein
MKISLTAPGKRFFLLYVGSIGSKGQELTERRQYGPKSISSAAL